MVLDKYNVAHIYICERLWRRASGLDFTARIPDSIRAAVRLAAVSAVCDFTVV
jgi:hypothetical protein